MFAQGGVEDLEVIQENGNVLALTTQGSNGKSIATCPITHKVIGGGIRDFLLDVSSGGGGQQVEYTITQDVDFGNNAYVVSASLLERNDGFIIQAYAMCAKINFPMMGMIGGELLDIGTVSRFVGAIGVNPVITGRVAITMGGVAAQAIWFVHRRKKKVE